MSVKDDIFWSEIGSGFGELGGNSMVHNYYNTYLLTKNQKRNNRYCVTCYVISMVYTLIDHSSRPISAPRIHSVIIVKSILVIDKAIGYDCNTDLS